MRLERGQVTGPSAGVVDAVAAALRLGEDERTHLDRLLAELTPEARKRRRRPGSPAHDAVQLLASWTAAAATEQAGPG